ncbi:MAG: insulinase family protein [Rhodospirillaceae bacterium]|nr:insulinase family protein [Rhodospirillaceae bacterium]
MSVEVTTLENGLRVASDTMQTVESVTLSVAVGVGTRHERPEINGISHLLEHMAFKGTKRRTAKAIAEEIEAVSGHLNAYTSRESTVYYAKVLKEDLPLAVDILADILQHSTFEPQELERERHVIVQEIGQAADTPDDVVFDHFQARAYPDQPMGRPILGTKELVLGFSRDSICDYLGANYTFPRMVVSAAGNLDHRALVEMVGNAFDKPPSKSEQSVEPAKYLGGDATDDRDLEQVHLVLGFEGLAYTDPDYYALAMFSNLLGGGMSSRLFQEVREKRGLAYSIYSFLSSYADGGIFGVYAGTGQDQVRELLPVIAEELSGLALTMAADELNRVRVQMKAGLLMAQESTGARCEQMAQQLLIYGRSLPLEEIVEKIEAVDATAIARVSARVLSSNPTYASLGPLKKLGRLDELGLSFN